MTEAQHHILEKNLFAVFGQRDPEQRRATIDELYTETCIFVEPTGVVTGRDAVHAVVEDLLAQHPRSSSASEGRRTGIMTSDACRGRSGPKASRRP